MKPNLDRIPATGDHVAREVLDRAPARVDQRFVDSLKPDERLALGRYGARGVTVALRQRSQTLLADALLAKGIAALNACDDARDLMVELAMHHVAAQTLGMSPGHLFRQTADRLPDGEVAALVRTFGGRTDVTLQAFGWELVDTPDGPDLTPT